MQVNRIGIHDTRPLPAGVAAASEAPWARWTRAGETAYLVLGADGQVRLPVTAGTLDLASSRLPDGTPVTASQDGRELVLEVPKPQIAGPVVVGFTMRA